MTNLFATLLGIYYAYTIGYEILLLVAACLYARQRQNASDAS